MSAVHLHLNLDGLSSIHIICDNICVYIHTEFSLAEMFDLMTYAMNFLIPSLKFQDMTSQDFLTSPPSWVMSCDKFPFYSYETFGQNSSNQSALWSFGMAMDGSEGLSDLHPDVAQNQRDFCVKEIEIHMKHIPI